MLSAKGSTWSRVKRRTAGKEDSHTAALPAAMLLAEPQPGAAASPLAGWHCASVTPCQHRPGCQDRAQGGEMVRASSAATAAKWDLMPRCGCGSPLVAGCSILKSGSTGRLGEVAGTRFTCGRSRFSGRKAPAPSRRWSETELVRFFSEVKTRTKQTNTERSKWHRRVQLSLKMMGKKAVLMSEMPTQHFCCWVKQAGRC